MLDFALRLKQAASYPIVWIVTLLALFFALGFFLFPNNIDKLVLGKLPLLFNRELIGYILVGFGAQMVDGALGMAYGVCSSTFLISIGVSPASASASVHVAEIFTTGASAISHHSFNNINKRLFKALVVPAVLGGVVGAYLLSSFDGNIMKPFVNVYLFIMGLIILRKALAPQIKRTKVKRIGLLAFTGGFLDSVGGGGWGPVVNSNLLSKGKTPRLIIGTVNTVEFFLTFASAGVFTLFMGLQNVQIIVGLVLGGVVAAPFGAYLVGKVKTKPLMIMVGLLVCFLSLRTLYKVFF